MKQNIFSIINYETGNYGSLIGIINKLGHRAVVTNKSYEINKSHFVKLPGVGTFGSSIKTLKKKKLDKLIRKISYLETPILGICLGMQLLTFFSSENGRNSGLRIIPGQIKENYKRNHHIGWNNINIKKNSDFIDFDNKSFYFQHGFSYFGPEKYKLSSTKFMNKKIVSIIQKDNVTGVQFHPEKSQQNGVNFLEKYIDIFK